ncbi:MAG: ABC transporter ATP-binding protein/permease [Clostridiales bacterium]|nr:ABC transporter ATP-binding protein/permease [Clostridiales bacterium]
MLKLVDIKKVYSFGDQRQTALNGVSVTLRKNEFVSILGPSGCGKTTLLNIIGGLDRYSEGDLIIKGTSTKEYRDGDWDTYRNRSIGFVFQNYNLIPHQSILSNVELAMTLSGVKRAERRQRAKEALEKVGLGAYIHKKPNQMSGGQMQRVAIARALVNNPEILLADEPTGALDSETSIQIMELLSEIAKDRLVVMVTHNPELAEQYSTRIIRLLDGRIVDDSDPYTEEETASPKKAKKKIKKKPMSFLTATSLSLNNLMTKKARTFLTSFAGSIGIIGIALILSLSHGINLYINQVQEDTLSTYPLTITREAMDYESMFSIDGELEEETHDKDKVYSNSNMQRMMNAMMTGFVTNDLKALKAYFEDPDTGMDAYTTDIKYTYDIDFSMYTKDETGKHVKIDSGEIMDLMYEQFVGIKYTDYMASMGNMAGMADSFMSMDIFSEMIDNEELLHSQYDLVYGSWPKDSNEMVLVLNKNNEIMDLMLYALGLRDREEIPAFVEAFKNGGEIPIDAKSFSYEDLVNKEFKLVLNTDLYEEAGQSGIYESIIEDEEKLENAIEAGETIKISGILRPSDNAVAASIQTPLAYTKDFTQYIIQQTGESEIVKHQIEHPDVDIFTGLAFTTADSEELTMEDVNAYIATLSPEEQQQYGIIVNSMDEKEVLAMFTKMMRTSATYDGNLKKLGMVDEDTPSSIAIYSKDFASKDAIEDIISQYNEGKDENDQITYTDFIGLMISSITMIINIISYVLIAFVSISLVVSSIMIGIITYISVLERTKEIGILRSIGASKKDISRVFNAETLIVGLAAGLIGILFTLLLCLPINLIIQSLSGISNVGAVLPWQGGLILIAISTLLTFIAGLIPAKIAAKKDPVVALRTE